MSSSVTPIFVHFDDNDAKDTNDTFASAQPRVTRKKSNFKRANSTLYTVSEHGNSVCDPVLLSWADHDVEDDFRAERMTQRTSNASLSIRSQCSCDFWPDETDISSYYGLTNAAMADFAKTHMPTIAPRSNVMSAWSPAPVAHHAGVIAPPPSNSTNAARVCLSLDAVVPKGPSVDSLPVIQNDITYPMGSATMSPPMFSIFDGLTSKPSYNGPTVDNTPPRPWTQYNKSTQSNEKPAGGKQQKIFLQGLC
eukprot:GEMP01048587.1.p2 GENE.GEMP01048587.1~~GEMP01048587.1.p2  ORF type:complete len:251 (+),score=63.92 GEMP01048587.1:61-813(+)